ncbi:cation diffusion facilitator family transporter [Treponema phagedenis]|uniref:Cation transporter n=1 Tax=Treponema phagedenis TaxID=162 RepID=A0AAE6IW09_TREPH|nr:cation diffusion facilitator family transporter [Treponema phagedenis]QEJ99233.1 cation transporter [Treponema phagedenis]QEK00139.1 cation transporter [Treponema phagedenis]QEK07634.1 cation transporter [Treponema phagedenis]QSH95127.1 cation transporter [Treponema phagedenis]
MPDKADKINTAEQRTKIVRLASYIALCGNLFLCVIKITAGILVSSLGLLGDGLDSATDVIVAVMTLIISFIITRPSDTEHPWGHQRAETMASLVLTFVIFTAGFQLFIEAGKKLFAIYAGQTITLPNTWALIVTIISIVGKLLLALNQYLLGKKADSTMILANAKNMVSDVVISVSVLLGFLLSFIFKAPYMDLIIALFVACWIMKTAIQLFFELNVELMDGNTNKQLYKKLFEAVQTVQGAKNPHRARIRKMANLWDIDLDIEVDGNMSVNQAHSIAEEITLAIKKRIINVYDIMVHIEPLNSDRTQESYGLTISDIE